MTRQRNYTIVTATPERFMKSKLPLQTTKQSARKDRYQLHGGPLNGAWVYLWSLPTAFIKVGTHEGRYGRSGGWEVLQ